MRLKSALQLSALTAAFIAPTTLAAAQDMTIETVVVTAQKRVQDVQDVPISMEVLSGRKLEELNVRTFEDMAKYVPNLTIQPTPGANEIYIRGIGSGSQNFAFEQAVSLYVDGVYAGRNRQFMAPFFDIERIEVMRGPQGALLGKNTNAGAISLISAQPTDTFKAGLDVTALLDRKGFDVSGFVSGPLSDHLTGRLAAKWVNEDGYVNNIAYDRKSSSPNDKMVRGTLKYEPQENADVTVKVEYSDSLVNGTPAIANIPSQGNDFWNGIKNAEDPFGYQEKDKTRSFNSVVTGNYGVGDNTLTSVSGYSTYNAKKFNSGSAANPNDWLTTQGEYFHQFSQELRLASPTGGTFEYIVGAYADTSKFKSHFDTMYDIGFVPPPRPSFAAGHSDMIYDQLTSTFSVFGQGQWNVTEEFEVSASLRYTSTSKDATLDYLVLQGNPVPALGPLIDPSVGNPRHLDGSFREETIDPSVVLRYKFNPLTMAYFTFAKGSKAGGFVSNTRTVRQSTFSFKPESSRNLEVGVKSTLLDGHLVGALTAFTTKFNDLQVSNYLPVTGITIGNAGSATTRGFEFSADMYPVEGLSLSLAGSYLDAKYDDFPGATCVVILPCNSNPALNNIGGTVLPIATKWSGTFGARYTRPLTDELKGTIGINGSFRSSYFTEADLNPNARSPAHTKVDGRIEIGSTEGDWSVALVGKNLTDVHSYNFSYNWPFDGAHRLYYLEPTRSFYVQASLRF